MRDIRLLIVLVAAMGLIVLGGVLVPVLLTWTLAPADRSPAPVAVADEPAKADPHAAKPSQESPPVPDHVDRLSEAFRAAAKRVRPAVVAVGTSQTVEGGAAPFGLPEDFLRRFFGREPDESPVPQRKFRRQGLGSGVIVDPDGYILTNNHVVAGADEITVRLADGREFKAEVVGADPPTEIAVIRIKADLLPAAELGDSDSLEVGDWVLAVGSPFGLEQTVTSGIISATGRAGVGIADYESFLQTDAAINPGNSGGPLVNMRGQVVGINTAIASRSGGYMGVGFAVPINLARDIMSRIREKGEVVRGWLGVAIQKLTPEMADSMKLGGQEGALVSQVFEGGPTDKAGIKVGDVILELDGKPVKTPADLQNAVAWTEPGKKIPLLILRDGERLTLAAEIEKRSDQPEVAKAEPGAPAEIEDLGIQISHVTPEAAARFGYKPGQGVLVTDVDDAGLAARAGLRPGMLILQVGNQEVANVAAFLEAMKGVNLAQGIPLLVRDGDRQMFVLIKKR